MEKKPKFDEDEHQKRDVCVMRKIAGECMHFMSSNFEERKPVTDTSVQVT